MDLAQVYVISFVEMQRSCDPYSLLHNPSIHRAVAYQPSNEQIQSATLLLHACPEASVSQQFLNRANIPQYII
jgi:hypothetical protein